MMIFIQIYLINLGCKVKTYFCFVALVLVKQWVMGFYTIEFMCGALQ